MSDDLYVCQITREPSEVRAVLDRDGDLWQRDQPDAWRCSRAKVPSLMMARNNTSWRHLVYMYGPLRAVHVPELPADLKDTDHG